MTGARRRAATERRRRRDRPGPLHGRHRRRSPPARGRSKLLAEHGIDVHIGIERLQVLATAPRPLDIRPVVYGPLAAKQYALFTRPAVVEPSTTSWRRTRSRPATGCCSSCRSAPTARRCSAARWTTPPSVTHDVTLKGLRDTALAIIDDFPGLRDVAIDRMWAGVLPFTSDQHPDRRRGAPRAVRRRRPHLRQRRRADDRQARRARCWPASSRRSTCPPAAGIGALEPVAAGDTVHW